MAYRMMPDVELMTVRRVRLLLAADDLPGRPRSRVRCETCGEHVIDGREVQRAGSVFCKACAGHSYYKPAPGGKAGEGYWL